jgi:hypothetical protein
MEVLLSLMKDKYISLLNITEQTAGDIEKQIFQSDTFPIT